MEVFSLTFVFVAIAVIAALDFIWSNFIIGRRENRLDIRYPFLYDLPYIIKNFDIIHDLGTDVMKARSIRHFVMRLAMYKIHTVVDPVDVKHVLKDNWKNYQVGTGLRGGALAELFGNGIFHADGDHWFMQRKHSSREFSANIFKNNMTHEFVNYTKKLIAVMNRDMGKTIDMHQMFFKLTLDAFGKVAFGVDLGGLDGKPLDFAKAFDACQEISAKRLAQKAPIQWKLERFFQLGQEKVYAKNLKIINDFVNTMVKQRLNDKDALEDRDDLLTKLIRVSEADKQSEGVDVSYLRDMTVNFLIAGRDTTACAMSWFIYQLAKNPRADEKLFAEIDSVCGDRAPSYDDFNEMPYLTAALSETLRLHPSVPFEIKNAVAADTLPCGAKISPSDSVAFLPYAMGRMEFIWGPDATDFRPERWINADGNFQREDPYKFVAFQAGPRLCLGVDMAMLEMKVCVTQLLQNFKFEVVEEPIYRVGLVLQMKNGLQVKLSPRK